MLNKINLFGMGTAVLTVKLYFGFSLFLAVVFACLVTSLIFLTSDYFATRDQSFGFLETVLKYIAWQKSYVRGFFIWRKLLAATKSIKELQEKELLQLLRLNSDTKYFKKWSLDQVQNRDDFGRLHPLVKYTHFEDDFERMIKFGEEKVICSQSPVYYAVTSGTTGKPSRIPFLPVQTQEVLDMRAVQAYKIGPVIQANKNLSRRLKLYYNVRRNLEKSANGTLIGPVSASSDVFAVGDMFTTPPAGYDIEDESSTRYIHLLFGLHERNLKKIETLFSTIVLSAFVDMETNWKDLVHDVQMGTLKSGLKLRDDTRRSLLEKLRSNPKRAQELQVEFLKGFKNIAKRVWPKLEVIECIASGPFAHYGDALKSQYTGDVLLWSNLYGASEGVLAANLWPFRTPPHFLLWPFGIFFEFIPLANVAESVPQTLFMDQVKIGEDYEIVITTAAGLYRYRLGDVVRVVEFFNECPVIEFLYRSGSLLNLKAEKVSEISLMDSLKEVVDDMSDRVDGIVDFTCCESVTLEGLDLVGAPIKRSVPYYVIFVELSLTGEPELTSLQKQVEEQWDAALIKNHSEYALYRKKGAIDHMNVYLLKPEAFVRFRSFILDNSSASPAQMKMPKLLRKSELVQFMWSERIVEI